MSSYKGSDEIDRMWKHIIDYLFTSLIETGKSEKEQDIILTSLENVNWKGFFEQIFFIHELNQDLIKEHKRRKSDNVK